MELIFEWRELVRKAWSFRLMIASALLSAAEVILPYVAPTGPSGAFAMLAFFVSMAAAWSRLVHQPKMEAAIDVAKDKRDDDAAAGL